MSETLVEISGLTLHTAEGRPLVHDLSLSLGRDHVALIGRNGVGKSTLLQILAGRMPAARGSVSTRAEPTLVPQHPTVDQALRAGASLRARAAEDRPFARALAQEHGELGLGPVAERAGARLSRGQVRKLLLVQAKLSRSELLLLDEPTEDMDEAGIDWLCRWLPRWDGGVIVVSHCRRLLRCFTDFFVVSESGCCHERGTFDDVVAQLQARDQAQQRRYVRHLNALAQKEQHYISVSRRRQRKKNRGRLQELRRCNSRGLTNTNRSYAQVSQARETKIREDRIGAVRGWAKATRRALSVRLSLELPRPRLPPDDGRPNVALHGVGVTVEGRRLLRGLELTLGRERLAVVGPNGAGKTTLLRVMRGEQPPTEGRATRRLPRLGSIAQGATDWELDDSLLDRLLLTCEVDSLDALAALVVGHRFPLALAQRPLRSLSPGERVRAALICLFARTPAVELLVLDEPTHSLDFVGLAALERALRAWPGGLIVVSHDRDFLEAIGIERTLELGGDYLAPRPIDQASVVTRGLRHDAT